MPLLDVHLLAANLPPDLHAVGCRPCYAFDILPKHHISLLPYFFRILHLRYAGFIRLTDRCLSFQQRRQPLEDPGSN